jgi:hypothetical protein
MPISFACPKCTKSLKVPDGLGGQRARCPYCGERVVTPGASTIPIAAHAPDGDPSQQATGLFLSSDVPHSDALPARVIVVDLDMPFVSMIGFLLKISLAAIPAAVLFAFIVGLIFIFSGPVVVAIFRALMQ